MLPATRWENNHPPIPLCCVNTPSAETLASVTRPRCPHCGAELELGSDSGFDMWACPNLHGLAATLSEAHGRLQDDELERLWELARSAPPGPLAGLLGGPNMVRFELGWDLDEVSEGAEGDTEDLGSVELDVDLDNRFIWFDTGELDELPVDLPNPVPTAEENAALERITAAFSTSIGDALAARDDDELAERIHDRLERRPALVGALDRVARAVTTYR